MLISVKIIDLSNIQKTFSTFLFLQMLHKKYRCFKSIQNALDSPLQKRFCTWTSLVMFVKANQILYKNVQKIIKMTNFWQVFCTTIKSNLFISCEGKNPMFLGLESAMNEIWMTTTNQILKENSFARFYCCHKIIFQGHKHELKRTQYKECTWSS